ncbi:hypothetical protein JTE90_025179, partial [Oedothorax gibbosus]
CFTLETCCGYGYGPHGKLQLSPLGFSRANKAHRTPARDAVLLTINSVPISDEPIPGHGTLTKKRYSSPGPPSNVSEFGCVTGLGPEGLSPVSPDLHRWALQAGLTPRLLPSHATSKPPTNCGRKPPEGACRSARLIGPTLEVIPFSGLVASVVDLLQLLSEFRFHGPSSDCLEHRNHLSWGYMSVLSIDALNRGVWFILTAASSCLLQKRPTGHSHPVSSAFSPARRLLNHLTYPDGNFGGNHLTRDGSISLTALEPDLTIDFAVRNRIRTSNQSFSSWARPVPGIVSPYFRVPRVRSTPPYPNKGTRRVLRCRPRPRGNGDPNAADPPPACTFISPPGLFKIPIDSRTCEYYHPIKVALAKQPTPRRSHPVEPKAMGLAPTLAHSPGQGDLLRSRVGSTRKRKSDSQSEVLLKYSNRYSRRGGVDKGQDLITRDGIDSRLLEILVLRIIAIANPQHERGSRLPIPVGKGKHTTDDSFMWHGRVGPGHLRSYRPAIAPAIVRLNAAVP